MKLITVPATHTSLMARPGQLAKLTVRAENVRASRDCDISTQFANLYINK